MCRQRISLELLCCAPGLGMVCVGRTLKLLSFHPPFHHPPIPGCSRPDPLLCLVFPVCVG